MVDSPSQRPGLRPWHELIEHYTPDGALGRFILAVGTGTLSWLSAGLTLISMAHLNLFWLFLGMFSAGLSLASAILTLIILWPIYLSLIGNIESSQAYPENVQKRAKRSSIGPADSGDSDDSIDVLTEQYARGNISEAEFERRLDTLLHVETESDSRRTSEGRQHGRKNTEREVDRT